MLSWIHVSIKLSDHIDQVAGPWMSEYGEQISTMKSKNLQDALSPTNDSSKRQFGELQDQVSQLDHEQK